MSSKSHLLIILFLGLAISLSAQSLVYSDTSIEIKDSDQNPEKNVFYRNHFLSEYDLSDQINLSSDNEFFSADRFVFNSMNERVFNRSALNLNYKNKNLETNLAYRFNYYDKQTEMYPYINLPYGFKRKIRNDYLFNGLYQNEKLYFSGSLMYRNLQYTATTYPAYKDQNDDELFYGGMVQYEVLKSFRVFVHTDIKDNLGYEMYDNNTLAAGIMYNKVFDYFKWLDLSQSIQWSTNNEIKQKRQLITEARYKQRIGTNLNGYVTYIHRMVPEDGEMLLLSNYFRIAAKYSLNYDLHGESYIQVGAKASPVNNAGAVFVNSDFYVINNLYLGYDYDYYQKDFRDLHSNEIHARVYFLKKNYLYMNYNTRYEGLNSFELNNNSSSFTFGAVFNM